MTDQEIKRIFEVYKPPFTYDRNGQWITDVNEKIIWEIRGWGYLQKFIDGQQVQDNAGKLIAELLNKEYERLKG